MGCNLRDLASPVPIQMTDLAGQRIAVDAFLTAYQSSPAYARGEKGKMEHIFEIVRVGQSPT